ncbi:ribonuclease III [Ottowia testudinis]|uniref:Ribonuclease 3 n=1 Tax=Ottowia testudinis TaxID=2816950 RepID=A0A975CCC7_9BURK|nr:ribonuclease III [Ottowia testudinis]QTD43853.1 ribonuclease III [Ottowia testudinis]
MSAPITLQTLQSRLQHRFSRPLLLEQALTHRSFSADHNERLEFLGDSVLNLAVAHMLYQALGSGAEGDLSRLRAQLVRQDSLHHLAMDLGFAPLLRLGEGEMRSGGQRRPSILADALEAIIGAVYLDAGPMVADALVRRLFERVEISPATSAAAKDAKTALQEWLQGRKMRLPQYEVSRVLGAAHRQTFEVVCQVAPLGLEALGQGASRRAAEQAAAAAMLQKLQDTPA